MSYFQPAFNPNAQFRVIAWRGLSVPGDPGFIDQGGMIPAGLLDERTLAVLYRQRTIEMVTLPAETEILSDDPPAPITDSDEETDDAPELVSDAQSEQPAIRRGRGRPRKSAAA